MEPSRTNQPNKGCRDDVKVLWCCSYLVWLVFEGSIPTWACFHFCDSFALFLFFVYCFVNAFCCMVINVQDVGLWG